MKRSYLFTVLTAVVGVTTGNSASIYVGDVAELGQGISAGTVGPDTANAGALTYAFFSAGDGYTNTSGGPQTLQITEANFNAVTGGTLTPFVAVLLGAGSAGADYNVLAKGDGILGVAGLNNAAFTVGGSSPSVVLNAGETLVAGFHQTSAMIPWEAPGGADGDYISDFGGNNGGDSIPVSGPLGDDANWSNLGREYRFDVGLDVIPEPSTGLLSISALAGLLLLRRRRRR